MRPRELADCPECGTPCWINRHKLHVHYHPLDDARIAADCVKGNTAAELGWRVLHFTTEMVMDQTAVETIRRVLSCPRSA